MAKYGMQVTIEAEQFLPDEDKIPKGVQSDGPRSPKVDPRAAWILKTEEGSSYVKPGDYVITGPNGNYYIMKKEAFEAMNYELLEG